MKFATVALALVAGLIAMAGVAHADPFSGMRGTAIKSTGRFGASAFYFGLNSTWESRGPNGKLLAAGTYALATGHEICFQQSVGTPGLHGCMRYEGRRNEGIVLALLDSKGIVEQFALPGRISH